MYSDKVMNHFYKPRNVGVIEDADGVGKVGNPVCGDMMELFIKVEDDVIKDVKFRTFGCGRHRHLQHGNRAREREDAGGGAQDNEQDRR